MREAYKVMKYFTPEGELVAVAVAPADEEVRTVVVVVRTVVVAGTLAAVEVDAATVPGTH